MVNIKFNKDFVV